MIYLKHLYEKLPPAVKAKVGDIVMGDENDLHYGKLVKLGKLQGLTPNKLDEPNTKWETELVSKLEWWVESSDSEISNYFKKNKDIFKQLAKEYPRMFEAPKGVPVYRGTKISRQSIVNVLSKQKNARIETIKSQLMVVLDGVSYKPKKSSQSWTLDPNVAFTFMKNAESDSKNVPVILSSITNSDFILSPELLAIFYDGIDEKEVVRVAREGKFTVMLSTADLIDDVLIHRMKATRPAFQQMVDNYNKFVKMVNSSIQRQAKLQKSKSINSLLGVVSVAPPNYRISSFDRWDLVPFNKTTDKFPFPLAKTVEDIVDKRAVMRFEDKFFNVKKEYRDASKKFLASLGK